MKQVDPEELTYLLDQANLGCTQRECKPNEKIVEEYQNWSWLGEISRRSYRLVL